MESNFYEGIVESLKKEAKKLNDRLTKLSDGGNVNNDYVATVKCLRETLELIKKYDWQLMYSEYKIVKDGKNVPCISIWEQNQEGNVRNNKTWVINAEKVISDDDVSTKENLINAINYVYNNYKEDKFEEVYDKTVEIDKVLNDVS